LELFLLPYILGNLCFLSHFDANTGVHDFLRKLDTLLKLYNLNIATAFSIQDLLYDTVQHVEYVNLICFLQIFLYAPKKIAVMENDAASHCQNISSIKKQSRCAGANA
jgi:hypothetical protein